MALLKLLIKRLILTLLVVPLLALPALYLTLKTEQGAAWLSQILSRNNYYQISISKIHHSFTQPFRFELENLRVNRDGKELIHINNLVAILNENIISDPNLLDYLSLENGKIELSDSSIDTFPLNSNWLLLKNINLTLITPFGEMVFNNANAGIAPWVPSQFMTQNSEFRFSASQFALGDLKGEHLLTHGRIRQDNITFYTIGANIGHGEATGNIVRNKNGEWIINQLYFNHFNWLSSETFTKFYENLTLLPPLTIKNLDIINTNIEGDNWALNNGNLSLINLELKEGKWSSQNGTFSFSADDLLLRDLHFTDPIVKLLLSDDTIAIQQINSRWQGGLIRADGLWQDNKLDINEITISAIEYTLPENWQSILNYPFPDWLEAVNIDSLKVMRSVLVDINPDFPFQITLLEIDGQKLRIIENHHIGLWDGRLSAHANNATFNKIDLRYPVVTLIADDDHIQFTKMNAFVDDGLIDSQLIVHQADRYRFLLNLSGQNVSLNLLTHWGWQEYPLEGEGDIEFELNKEGRHRAIKAKLAATTQEGLKIIQTLPKIRDNHEQNNEKPTVAVQHNEQ